MPKFVEVPTEDWLKTTLAAKRYQWWQHTGAGWLEGDEDGLAGLAFACQLDLAFIDKATDAELMDAIADFSLKQAESAV